MGRDNENGHLTARGGFGSLAGRRDESSVSRSSMHHSAKGSRGVPVSSLRRTVLQLSQAANSPVPRLVMRPASALSVCPGGVGGKNDVTESNIKVYIRTRPAATINGAVCVTPDAGASSMMVQAQVTDVKGTP